MIGIIANPYARGVGQDGGLAERLAGLLGSEGRVYTTSAAEELPKVMDELRDRGAECIAICGGDGTMMSTLTAMVHTFDGKRGGAHGPLPLLLPLRGGTVNTIAKNLGLSGDPEDALRRLLARRRAGREVPTTEVDLLAVNDRYGFLFGAAMVSRFFDAYYGGPRIGISWAGVLAARTIASALTRGPFARDLFAPVEAEVVVDGRTLEERRFSLLFAATVPQVGMGFRPTYRAGTEPGRFHLLASSLPPMRLARQVHRVLRGEPLEGKPHTDVLAARVEITFEREQSYIFDGDLFAAQKMMVTCGPRLSVLRP